MKKLLIGLALLATSLGVMAKEVEGLYQAQVLVPDQSADSRKQGAQQGLMEVLHKVTGYPVSTELVPVAKAISIADQYLYQFSFERLSEKEAQQKGKVGASWLSMRFEPKSIQRIVLAANLPNWGKNRPTILVWLAVEEGQRKVITDGADDAANVALLEAANTRGLPIILPIYDLEDSIKLPMAQIWGLFSDPIQEASRRYGAESVLAGRVFKSKDGEWLGHWRFYFRNQAYDYNLTGQSLNEVVLSGLTASGGVLADAFAIKPSAADKGTITLAIDKVNTVKDYARLTAYLEKLAITKNVTVKRAQGSQLVVSLELRGTFDQFKQTLELDRKLLEKPVSQEEEPSGPAALPFVWQP